MFDLFARHHHGNDNPWADAPAHDIELRFILGLILEGMNQMALDLTKITTDITAQTTVLQGVVVAQKGLSDANAAQAAQIVDLKAALAAASVTDPAVQAAVDALDKSVTDNTALVAGLTPAVKANTPSA